LSGYRWGVERKRKLLDLESLPSSPSDHASASATVENAA
jgi:hypothetical protein